LTVKQWRRLKRAGSVLLLVLLLAPSSSRASAPRLPFSVYRLPELSQIDQAGGDSEPDDAAALDLGRNDPGTDRNKKIVGAAMFASGVFLCSWGIVDWQTSDTQCCPARNTENVAKIVVGVVLVNAGLVYLIAGGL
jgi:hypothetical protein